jgi:tetratricopeptide (TPR) repeat protein
MVQEGDIEVRKLLLRAQEQVIRELAAANLEVLVPMAMLHHELYRRHLEQGKARHALLTVHARNMARDLALLYEKHAGTEQARATSARILTSLGGYLLDSSQQLLAGQLFTLATGFDPASMGAHLGLATIYEKNGRYDAAVGSLRNTVAVDPMRVEAWLRLGVNLARLGQEDEARRALEPLTKIATWVGAVAVQELAGMHTKEEQWPAAEAILRAGLERMPNEGALYLQLCAVLDRQGRRGESQELMQRFLAIPAAERGTSRLRYNRDPAEVWAEVRKRLDESSRTSLPMLAQALGLPPSAPRTGEASR